MESNLSNLRARSSDVLSGFCYIGSYDDNFHLVIKCPVHVYAVIKKVFEGSSICVSFMSGNLPLTHLVLPQFLGTFRYRDKSGKVRKYHSAFVYPLDLNYKPSSEEYSSISAILSVFSSYHFEFYDKKDRSLKTLFTLFAEDFVESVDSLISAFGASGVGPSSTQIK